MRFVKNHNTPETREGRLLSQDGFKRLDLMPGTPQMIHMGFAASAKTRAAKNRYYEVRGEADDPKRRWYTESRRAFETWQPGDPLPHGAKVIGYDGPVPEVFQEQQP